MTEIITHTVEETESLGERLGRLLAARPVKPVILLVGELGAGKTAFTRGLAHGLGAKGPVQSPTFTFVREYYGTNARNTHPLLLHVDLYRLNDMEGLLDLGLDDFLMGRTVAAIEWGDRAREAFTAQQPFEIHFAHQGPEERRIRFLPENESLWSELS